MKGYYRVGGIVGFSSSLIECSFNVGDIFGDSYIGGIAGENHIFDDASEEGFLSAISKCYNSGNVVGYARVGGLFGSVNSTSASINLEVNNSYSLGNLDYNGVIVYVEGVGYYYSGGIGGVGFGRTVVSNCYFVTFVGTLSFELVGYYFKNEVSVNDSYLYTANYMKTSAFVYVLNTGLSENLWVLDSNNINNGYPVLNWQVN